jgi:hypothetical protein
VRLPTGSLLPAVAAQAAADRTPAVRQRIAKIVRGFWLFRWFTETPTDRMAEVIDRTVQLADSGVLRVPEGQPIPVEKFSDAVYLAEAPEHGGKPLLVFNP